VPFEQGGGNTGRQLQKNRNGEGGEKSLQPGWEKKEELKKSGKKGR